MENNRQSNENGRNRNAAVNHLEKSQSRECWPIQIHGRFREKRRLLHEGCRDKDCFYQEEITLDKQFELEVEKEVDEMLDVIDEKHGSSEN